MPSSEPLSTMIQCLGRIVCPTSAAASRSRFARSLRAGVMSAYDSSAHATAPAVAGGADAGFAYVDSQSSSISTHSSSFERL